MKTLTGSARTRSIHRQVVALILVAVSALVPAGRGALFGVEQASAAATLSASPSTDLVDGQDVTVSGAGFTDMVLIALCPVGLTDAEAEDCAWAQELVLGQPDEAGSFSLTFRISALVAESGSGTFTDCRSAMCELVGLEWQDDGGPVVRARVPMAFDPVAPLIPAPVVSVNPDSDLFDGQTVSVGGAGFDPEEPFTVQLCAADGTETGCRSLGSGVTSASGDLITHVKLRATVASYETEEARIDCRSASAVCQVQVYADAWRQPDPVTVDFDPAAPLLPLPLLSAHPPPDVVDGQVVHLSGSGFDPGSWVVITQCGPTDLDGNRTCRSNHTSASPDPIGAIESDLAVRTIIKPWADSGDEPVDCRVQNCVVRAYSPDGSYVFPLDFDPDAPLMAPPSVSVDPSADIVDGEAVAVDPHRLRSGHLRRRIAV